MPLGRGRHGGDARFTHTTNTSNNQYTRPTHPTNTPNQYCSNTPKQRTLTIYPTTHARMDTNNINPPSLPYPLTHYLSNPLYHYHYHHHHYHHRHQLSLPELAGRATRTELIVAEEFVRALEWVLSQYVVGCCPGGYYPLPPTSSHLLDMPYP